YAKYDSNNVYNSRLTLQSRDGTTAFVNTLNVTSDPSAHGAVGIGTISPQATLDVNGTARVVNLPSAHFNLVTTDTNKVLGSILFPSGPSASSQVLFGNGLFGSLPP